MTSGAQPSSAIPDAEALAPRVLLAFDWFWKYAAAQALALRRAGAPVAMLHRTHVYEFAGRTEERDALLASVRQVGVNTFAVPGRVRSVRALPAITAVRQRLRSWRPDIVHAHDNADPRLLVLTRGMRLVVTVHDPRPHLGAASPIWLRVQARKAWLRRADRIIVHGEALRDVLAEDIARERIAVVPHGADVAAEPLPVPSAPAVLLFGRLEPYKGLRVLLEAMRLVWRERPDTRLVVAGTGPEAAVVPDDPRVERVEGYVPEAQLDALFARATLVALPYLEGSQSGVGLQAIARGVPVVASRVGSLPELTARDLVVPPGDAAALAAALLRTLGHHGALRERTLDHAGRHFSWDVLAERSLALYREVLAE